MLTHADPQNNIITDVALMKREIKEIKTHFATKADLLSTKNEMIIWVVGVGVAAIVSVAGLIWNLDTRLTQDMREMRQAITSLSQEIKTVSQETKKEIALLSQETKRENAALSKKIDEQNHKRM